MSATATDEPRFASPDAYTPPHLAEKILTSREALEGERKQVTVLFADLKGSMELLADRDPEEARTILDPVLERLMEAVHRYEGTVNQVMGDGIMALFGAPLAHEDHAVRACYAALRMQAAIRRYTEELRRAHGAEVQIRVGLNSGAVVVRSIGSDLHMDYTAVGQTTHLAARMEQLAPPGSIRLTAETLRLAEGYVTVKPLGPIPVKGLAEPIDVYELTGAGGVRTRFQVASARGLTRFVGRDAELVQLRQAAEQARGGHGQVVAVVGEPGVGKSRLFHEFLHSHRTHDWLVLESASVSYGKATAYLPLIDLLKGYFKIDDRDDTRSVRAKVTGTMLTLDEALKESVPPVLWLLEALPDQTPMLDLEPARRRQRILEAIRRLLLRESRVQPLLLVFEDLHWADPETQAFLDTFVESVPTAAALLTVNYRPEYQHSWGSKTYYRQLRIDPLPAESAAELLETLLGADPSVEPLKRLLIDRTEGNPLFLEESVRTLVETHVLAGERGAYRLAEAPETIQIPATVQAILAARIDRLSPELKRLLQAASVVGKDVPFPLLQAIAGEDEATLRRDLAQLQAAELVYEARLFPDLEYTFKHALTHEVAYGSLLHDRRRALHAAIVEAIERASGDRLGEQIERLAYHAQRAEAWPKAAAYFHQAGQRAAARSAYREAIDFLQRALTALEQLPESPDRVRAAIEIRVDLGPALIALKAAGAEVEASYRHARDLCDRYGETSRLFEVQWGLWFVNNIQGRHTVARRMGEELLAIAERHGDTAELLQAHHALWPILVETGELRLAGPHLERGSALYDLDRHRSHAFLYGNHDPGVCAGIYGARRLWLLGFPEQAGETVEAAVRLAKELDHPYTSTFALGYGAMVHFWRGDDERVRRLAGAAVELAVAHGIATHFFFAALLLSRLLGTSEPQEDRAALLAELEARRAGFGGREAVLRTLVAELAFKEGDPRGASESLDRALRLVEGGMERYYEPEIHRQRGEVLLRLDAEAAESAERCFRRALELSRRRETRSLELRAATSLALLLRGQGKREDARRELAPVYGAFTEGFETADLRAAKSLLDVLS